MSKDEEMEVVLARFGLVAVESPDGQMLNIDDEDGRRLLAVTRNINPSDLRSLMAYACRQYDRGVVDGRIEAREAIRQSNRRWVVEGGVVTKEEIGAALEALGLERQEDGNLSRFTRDGHTLVIFTNDEVSFHGTVLKPRSVSVSFAVKISELERRGHLQVTLKLLLDELRVRLVYVVEAVGWIGGEQ